MPPRIISYKDKKYSIYEYKIYKLPRTIFEYEEIEAISIRIDSFESILNINMNLNQKTKVLIALYCMCICDTCGCLLPDSENNSVQLHKQINGCKAKIIT
jgi:hypothetical protein